ncbi:hypothetical protein D3C86_1564540 [compost metagenome]
MDIRQAHARWHAFQENVDALLQENPSARENHEADAHGEQRIDPLPAGEPDDRRTCYHRHRSEHVRPDLEIGPPDVEALFLVAGQKPHRNQVDHETDDGDQQHAAGLDLLRQRQALPGLVENVEGDGEQ